MTQEIFKTRESIRNSELKGEKKRAFELWKNFGPVYRMLPLQYETLVEERKKLGLTSPKLIKRSVISLYPEIEFLALTSEAEVTSLIKKWATDGSLQSRMDRVEETFKTNVSINTLRSWITDFNYSVSRKKYSAEKKRRLKGL